MSRRSFILSAATATAALPFHSVFGAVNRKPALALIGRGKQGRDLLHQFLGQDVVVRAVCDVDADRRADALKVVRDYYAAHPQLGIPPDSCRAFADFREVLADASVDMVAIATPDHWHAYMTVAALKAGKDVYCETPLTYSVAEAKAVLAAAKASDRIVQVGGQLRSSVEFRTAAMLCRNGAIGKVRYVDCNFGGPSRPHRDFLNPVNAAAEGAPNPRVDFDLWLGGAPAAPYSDQLSPRGVCDFFPSFWRFDDNYANGACGDAGVHHLDIAQWGLDLDASGPVKVVKSEASVPSDKMLGGRRQSGVELYCADGTVIRHNPPGRWGIVFYGTDGIVAVNRGAFALWTGKGGMPDTSLRAAVEKGAPDGMSRVSLWYEGAAGVNKSLLDAVNKAVKAFKLKKAPVQLYKSLNHVADFVACCAARKAPCSPAEVGARAAILAQLCNVSYVHDAGFNWDPAANACGAGADASWFARPVYRNGWTVR